MEYDNYNKIIDLLIKIDNILKKKELINFNLIAKTIKNFITKTNPIDPKFYINSEKSISISIDIVPKKYIDKIKDIIPTNLKFDYLLDSIKFIEIKNEDDLKKLQNDIIYSIVILNNGKIFYKEQNPHHLDEAISPPGEPILIINTKKNKNNFNYNIIKSNIEDNIIDNILKYIFSGHVKNPNIKIEYNFNELIIYLHKLCNSSNEPNITNIINICDLIEKSIYLELDILMNKYNFPTHESNILYKFNKNNELIINNEELNTLLPANFRYMIKNKMLHISYNLDIAEYIEIKTLDDVKKIKNCITYSYIILSTIQFFIFEPLNFSFYYFIDKINENNYNSIHGLLMLTQTETGLKCSYTYHYNNDDNNNYHYYNHDYYNNNDNNNYKLIVADFFKKLFKNAQYRLVLDILISNRDIIEHWNELCKKLDTNNLLSIGPSFNKDSYVNINEICKLIESEPEKEELIIPPKCFIS